MSSLRRPNTPTSPTAAHRENRVNTATLILAAAVLLVMGLASIYWLSSEAPNRPTAVLTFQAIADPSGSLTPQQAFQAASAQNLSANLFSARKEHPFWAVFSTPGTEAAKDLELDSRHLMNAKCYAGSSLALIGEAGRDVREGRLSTMRRGFRVQIPRHEMSVLCQMEFVGPARFSAALWDRKAANEAQDDFQRVSGLLDGAVAVLAVFACVLGFFSKSRLLFMYAAWMIACSRLASSSVGMDFAWLGLDIPAVALTWSRKAAMIGYVVFSLALVQQMFHREFRKLRLNKRMTQAQWGLLLVSAAIVWMPYRDFLPFAWGTAVVIALIVLCSLVEVVRRLPSSTAWVYFTAWCFAIFSQFGEIVAGSLGLPRLFLLANSVTSSLIATFLVAAALADRVRKDRMQRKMERDRTVEALELVKRTYQSVPLGLFTTTPDGEILRNNPTFDAMMGLKRVNGTISWSQVGSHLPIQELLGQALKEQATFRFADRVYRMRAVAVKNAFECSLADVTTESNSTARLQHLVDHDALTDVMNRRGLNAWIDTCHAGRRWGSNVTVAYVDLNRFKLINELFGYSAGDYVLKEVANRLKYATRHTTETIARLGGDEFLIIFEGKNELEIATAASRIVRMICDSGFEYQDKRFSIGVSVGILTVDSSLTFVDALSAADQACHLARSTKERTFWARNDDQKLERYRAEQTMARAFEQHLPVERFFIEFQPIVSLVNPSKDLSAEVLIRMRDENGKMVSPGQFLPTAERQGLMSQIDWWVLKQTTNWLIKNVESMKAMNYIAVNLNGASLNDEAFLDKVSEYMQDHRAIGNKILFEITESVAMNDIGNTIKFVNRMKELGVRIALDDFGAGYTSFGYLQEFPADVLKLDGAFVRQANERPQNHRIIRSISDLAHQLGMKCVAEWAENANLVRTLHELGADYAQGWGLCKSIDPSRFIGISSSVELVTSPDVVDYLRLIDKEFEQKRGFLVAP